MSRVVLLKLGGSLITDKSTPYTVRAGVLERLAREIRTALDADPGLRLVVGHGGGSFPHVSAARYRTHLGVVDEHSWEGFRAVQADAARLNHRVREALVGAGVPAVPVQPSAAAVARARRIESWPTTPIERLLAAGQVPVPYGDVAVDLVQGCCILSTEELFRHLAATLAPAAVIMAGKVDGVLDEQGRVIPSLTERDLDAVAASVGGSDGAADVTGGMVLKVRVALEIGVPVHIVNGLVPSVVEQALLGRPVGTRVGA